MLCIIRIEILTMFNLSLVSSQCSFVALKVLGFVELVLQVELLVSKSEKFATI